MGIEAAASAILSKRNKLQFTNTTTTAHPPAGGNSRWQKYISGQQKLSPSCLAGKLKKPKRNEQSRTSRSACGTTLWGGQRDENVLDHIRKKNYFTLVRMYCRTNFNWGFRGTYLKSPCQDVHQKRLFQGMRFQIGRYNL